MRLLAIVWLRLRSLLFRTRLDADLDEELRYHVERQVAQGVAAGLDPVTARRTALGALGGLTYATEECRDMRGLNMIEHTLQDVRFALRQFRRTPLFSVTAVLLLALGIWASTTIFTFVNAALIKPLPYVDPDRLVAVFGRTLTLPRSNLSYLDYVDLKQHNDVFESISALQGGGATLTTAVGAERIGAARVSDDFFRTLGVAPVLGRDFRPGEDLPAAAPTVIIAHATWMKRFGGVPDVLGRSMTLNGEPHVIVGVLPASFRFAPVEPAEAWRTLRQTSGCDRRRGCHNLTAVARMKQSATIASAGAGMNAIARQLEQQYPDSNRDQSVLVMSMASALIGDTSQMLKALLGAAALLLLIASVNVASLLLVRSESRRREFSIRAALGASSARVVRQFAVEGLVLVTMAATVAVVAVDRTAGVLVSFMPAPALARLPFLETARPGAAEYLFVAFIAAAATLLFAVLPMLQLSTAGSPDTGRGSSGQAWRRLGTRLVVVELTLAMVLLVGAGLLTKSLYRLLGTEIGLQPDRLATMVLSLPSTKYAKPEQMTAFAGESLERIRTLPGIRSAAISSTLPLLGGNTMWIRVVGRPYNGEHNEVHYREISPGYFATLGAQLVRGRDFGESDDASRPPVVVINEAFARTYFPGEEPVGKHLLYAPTSSQPPMEVVGIVADIKESPLDKDTPPTIYVAFAQDPTPGFALVVRAIQEEQSILPTLAAEIRAMDPAVVAYAGRTMTTIIDESPAAYTKRAAAWLVGGFAVSAWLLAVVGLYGVIAYSVSQRTREIAVRMALGAERTSVVGLVLGEAGRLTVIGVTAGAFAAVGVAMLLRSVLFEVQAWDAAALAIAAGVLTCSAGIASYLPARRAASVSPTEALRAD